MYCVQATPEQIAKIVDKYLNPRDCKDIKVGTEDKECFYIRIKHTKYGAISDFKLDSARATFFQLEKGDTRYAVNYPAGELLQKLMYIGHKVIADWKAGPEL